MEAPRLSDLIRAGYEQPAPGQATAELIATRERERLERHLPLTRHSPAALDALLLEVVGHYRTGPRAVWAPFLLEILAPAIGSRLERYYALQPVLSEEDIHQQLIVEILEVALTLRLPEGCRLVDRRILNRATDRLNDKLQRELRRQGRQVPLPEPEHEVDQPPAAKPKIRASVQKELERRGLKEVTIDPATKRRLIRAFGDVAREAFQQVPEIRVRKSPRGYRVSGDQPNPGCGER